MKVSIWKDREKEIIDPRLFSKTAEEFAIKINEENQIEKSANKRTQLRKFYDEIVRLNVLVKAHPESWSNILPLVHMVTAKAAYAKGRKLISDGFLEFIKHGIEQVESPRDLEVFSIFFEAFFGFYKMHGKE